MEEIYVMTAPDRAAVKAALSKRRAKNLAAFRAYRKAGVYPHNTVRVGPLNVWLDAQGHLCAAATMISKDGKHELALETGRTNNFIRLMNVVDGPLYDWMLTSGFTLEEIDQIQVPGWQDDRPVIDWKQEDARLAKLYAATDAALVKGAKKSLEVATNRLMKNPDLARRVVEGRL